MSHDNADRVTSFGHSFATTSRNVTWGFSFNPAGGIVGVSTTNTDFDHREQQSGTENHTFNGLNQDAAIAALATTCSAANAGYDCSGNLTNDSNRHFTYDIDNHLTALSGPASASYVYDPIGRLVQTTVNSTVTRFLYDGTNLVAEYDGLGAIQRRYMHTLGTDQPWVQFTGSAVGASNAKYLYGDYHGSIIALADNAGAVANVDIYKYGTYGEPLDINNNLSFSGSRFRYTGQTVLPEANLYYYKARVYDPVFGRFLQTDPIGSKDDLDLYAYVGGDPINKTDPTGNTVTEIYDPDSHKLWIRDNDTGVVTVGNARSGGDREGIERFFQKGPPIENGTYDILQGPHPNDKGMYRLERVGDGQYGDDKTDDGRNAYREHTGTRTAGCLLITLNGQNILAAISNTKTTTATVLNNNKDPSKGKQTVTKCGILTVAPGSLQPEPRGKAHPIDPHFSGTVHYMRAGGESAM